MSISANVEPDLPVKLINAASGLECTIDDLMKAGKGVWNLERAIYNRMGLRRAPDMALS